MTTPGDHPAPSGETAQSDGSAPEAPVDMATACQSVVMDAFAHSESEARKVGM